MSYEKAVNVARDAGISACFGIPGGGLSLELVDGLNRAGIPFYLSHIEGSAAIMAAAYGRCSEAPGLSLSIKGPGLMNALPGIASAWFEASPLVHITESTPTTKPSWVAHKRLPQTEICAAITKSSGYISHNGSGLEQALTIASSEEPAPVLLEMAEGPVPDLPEITCETDIETNLHDFFKCARGAKRPVIIVGAYAVRQKLGGLLSNLTVPIFTTVAAKGLVDESYEFSAGIYTGAGMGLAPEQKILTECDLIISVGLTARELLSVKKISVPSVHVSSKKISGQEGFGFTWTLRSERLSEVIDAIRDKQWGDDLILSSKGLLRKYLTQHFLPGQAFEILQNLFAGKARLVLDTGSFCTVGEHVWNARQPNMFLSSAQGRYMGTSLPMALGAALFDRTTPTLAVMGDGGIGMYIADIKLAVKHKLPILVILMSDGGFGSIRGRAREKGFSFLPIQVDGKSWVPCLNGLGIPSERVETANALECAVQAWTPANGPAFIEVGFNPDKYETMTAKVRA